MGNVYKDTSHLENECGFVKAFKNIYQEAHGRTECLLLTPFQGVVMVNSQIPLGVSPPTPF